MTLTDIQAERYARHLVLDEIGEEGQKKLLSSSVLVIGAGGLGSAALMYLASAGIGRIGIADDDRVELSNLQRQVIHRPDRIGIYKTQSARQTLEEFDPQLKTELFTGRVTVENIRQLIESYDFIIDATDRFETKFLINDACVIYKKPYVHAGIVRFGGQAMTYVPGKGPCLRCLMGQVPQAPTCAQVGVLGAAIGVLGSIQALEAVKYILGVGELLTGRILTFDGLSMSFKQLKMQDADPECAVCSKHPTITSLSQNRADYEIKK